MPSANLFLFVVLLRVQLYNQLLIYFLRYLVALRVGEKLALHRVGIPFKPAKLPDVVRFGSRVGRYYFQSFRLAAYGDYVAGFQGIGRDIHDFAVHRNVAVANQLAGAAAGGSNTQAIYRVVETRFEELEQHFAGYTVTARSVVESFAELALQHTIGILRLLLFRQLLRVVRALLLFAREPVLAGRIFTALKIFVQSEDRVAKGACFFGSWSCITSHFKNVLMWSMC